jgi:hypothetical protein
LGLSSAGNIWRRVPKLNLRTSEVVGVKHAYKAPKKTPPKRGRGRRGPRFSPPPSAGPSRHARDLRPDRIAGRGDKLSDMTTSGSVKARIREDLIFALEACAIAYGLE